MVEISNANRITVEVAYALSQKQFLKEVQLDAGATVQDAIEASGVLDKFGDIDLKTNRVGIFSKPAKLDTALREQDRVEIYRPLIADPKEVRRQRAAEGKVMKAG